MKWVNEDGLHTCVISNEMDAHVWDWNGEGGYIASIVSAGFPLWETETPSTEAEAKAAVVDWIDRTITQLSNAKVAGRPQVDEE